MTLGKSSSTNGHYQVRALDRALDILDAFRPALPELTITEIADRVNLPKSTVVRLAAVLAERGYLERCQGSDAYRIGVRAFEIGSIYIQTVTPEVEARPIMAKLVKETEQTANLGVLEQGEVVHLAVVAPDRPVRYWAAVGKREAPHYSGLGKALLAALPDDELTDHLQTRPLPRRTPMTICDPEALRVELEQVRQTGWAIDNEESNTGICCVAAPIFGQFGQAVAALSISGLKAEFSSENLPRYIDAVVRAGAAISERLGSKAAT